MGAVATQIQPALEFFQQDSIDDQRKQAQWSIDNLGLSTAFFARLLKIEEQRFNEWAWQHGSLSSGEQEDWRAFWRLVLHLLSLQNSDPERVKDMLDAMVTSSPYPPYRLPPQSPPWIGTSLREYLEAAGTCGVQRAEEWITSLRFRDLYAGR